MAYGRFRFDWKNFAIGIGTMFVILCLPVVSSPFATIIDKIRSKISGDTK